MAGATWDSRKEVRMISARKEGLRRMDGLNLPLNVLSGVGPKRARLFADRGLTSIGDLLLFMPLRYEDRRRVIPIHRAEGEKPVLVRGKVSFSKEEIGFRGRGGRFKIIIRDDSASLELVWFHYRRSHLRSLSEPGKELIAYGRVRAHRGKLHMAHPDVQVIRQGDPETFVSLLPVYPTVRGMSQQRLRSAVGESLSRYGTDIIDAVPRRILDRLGLPNLGDALGAIHNPPPEVSALAYERGDAACHRRLVFDHFFTFMLGVALRKRNRRRLIGPVFSISENLTSRLKDFFPFEMTGGQARAIADIVSDVRSGRSMNRLLQGDVGCGKTAVAAVAAHLAVSNGYQAAIMAPTHVLASQHFATFTGLSERMGFRPGLLTGALTGAGRRDLYDRIASGQCNLLIGTQALIQQGLAFANLGLVIIDEQHRFGVRQRSLLDKKGNNPHLLVMSATPIPRTLAMTVYADLDITAIREYPAGRSPVVTRMVRRAEKRWVYETIKKRMMGGEQVMVICPVIDRSEDALDMAEGLKRIYPPPFRVDLLHGRLAPDEKERILACFRRGDSDLLVGTTVVEVGVHAPGATVMVVEQPERFGLAQLHQLRGRVGRRHIQGLCLLMVTEDLPEESRARLEVLVQHHDGFEIAQRDLELRGQGELTGVRQAGGGELVPGEMFRFPELLMAAKEAAEEIVKDDPELNREDHRGLRKRVAFTSDAILPV
jgi:ATP-dependent DNA helicase RecG